MKNLNRAIRGLSLFFLLYSNDNKASATPAQTPLDPITISHDTVHWPITRFQPAYTPLRTAFSTKSALSAPKKPTKITGSNTYRRAEIVQTKTDSQQSYSLKLISGYNTKISVDTGLDKTSAEKITAQWLQSGTVDFIYLFENLKGGTAKQSLGYTSSISFESTFNRQILDVIDSKGHYFGSRGRFSANDIAGMFEAANKTNGANLLISCLPIGALLTSYTSTSQKFTLGHNGTKKIATYSVKQGRLSLEDENPGSTISYIDGIEKALTHMLNFCGFTGTSPAPRPDNAPR